MPEPRYVQRLCDIIETVEGLRELARDLNYDVFVSSWTLKRAVERGVEIISEATRHLPVGLTNRHPEVAWHDVRGIGNHLRHAYADIDLDILWQILTIHLNPLERAVRSMLNESENGQDSPT